MAPPAREDDDDARHKREEAERRAKRKATKSSKKGQSEKDRKRKEHAQRVLNEQNKKKKTDKSKQSATAVETSKFEALFREQRSQGFVMEFAFRNAPPRPPVGPCFVGLGLDGQLLESSQYHPTVELNYTWKLHSEPDLGVPLAPSAMDSKCYQEQKEATPATAAPKKLHPDDEALLNWKGSMGDSAAEELKLKRDQARATARLALKGNKAVAATMLANNTSSLLSQQQLLQPKKSKRKEHSRVLEESMQSWMKKTTYLSNDYSGRARVHDFTSLAKTKQRTARDLEAQQAKMDENRSADKISKTFEKTTTPTSTILKQHPSKPHLQPSRRPPLPLLPNVADWGHAYTHVVLDHPPRGQDATTSTVNWKETLDHGFVAHVEKQQANARMTCQVLVPASSSSSAAAEAQDGSDNNNKDKSNHENDDEHYYRPIQQYDLDVVPLKEEDAPHSHFAIWVGKDDATYLPISSRVLLSTGRPVRQQTLTEITRRPATQQEERELQERTSEVDVDVARVLESSPAPAEAEGDATEGNQMTKSAASSYDPMDVDDDSSDDEDFEEGTEGAA